MLKHIVEAGATVPVSEPVAVIGEPGEEVAGEAKKLGGGEAGKPVTGKPVSGNGQPTSTPPAPPARAAAQPDSTAIATSVRAPDASGRVKASPLARRIASERGLDLGVVAGTGPEGRIVARDLEQAQLVTAPRPAAQARTAPLRGPPAQRAPAAPFKDVPLTQIRKTIARRLAQSIGPVPTFYLTTEVDMERVWEARAALSAEPKVSFNDIIIKSVATALRQHPACNAWWQDDHIRYWNEVHVGMAVAVEDGLITPVIRYAEEKTLRQIAAEARDLAGRARERRLKPEEYTGATFSISNLGMLDIDEFTAVINPPEAGILAVGRIAEKPVAHEGVVAVRRRMRLTMSCDHRVIDGATGAQFLKTLKTMLENPLALVW
jgi:pyruvate dehydrogenase E2 component (dihydrolipoamide acetyltransferase)